MIPFIFLLAKNYQHIAMLILFFGTVCVPVFIAAFMRREDFLSSSYIQRLFMESTPFLEENKPEKLNKILAFEICLELVSIQLRDFP